MRRWLCYWRADRIWAAVSVAAPAAGLELDPERSSAHYRITPTTILAINPNEAAQSATSISRSLRAFIDASFRFWRLNGPACIGSRSARRVGSGAGERG